MHCNDCDYISLQHSPCTGYVFRAKEISPGPYPYSGIFSMTSPSLPFAEISGNWQLGPYSTTGMYQDMAMAQWRMGQAVKMDYNIQWCSWKAKNQENRTHRPSPAILYSLWSSCPSMVLNTSVLQRCKAKLISYQDWPLLLLSFA